MGFFVQNVFMGSGNGRSMGYFRDNNKKNEKETGQVLTVVTPVCKHILIVIFCNFSQDAKVSKSVQSTHFTE
jgi:hypothetical protein